MAVIDPAEENQPMVAHQLVTKSNGAGRQTTNREALPPFIESA